MKLEKKFDLIISPLRVFSHMVSVEDQLKFLNNVYEHLNEGATFIFDLFVPDPKMISAGMSEHIDFEGEYKPGKKLRRITSFAPDFIH